MSASLSALSAGYVEQLYARWLQDPGQVAPEWRDYFQQSDHGDGSGGRQVGTRLRPGGLFAPAEKPNGRAPPRLRTARLQESVDLLIRNYRVRGHMLAKVDPLAGPRPRLPELELEFYGFSAADLDRPFSTSHFPGSNVQTLRDIVTRLQSTYCEYVGAQFMHIDELQVRHWLQDRMEGTENRPRLSRQEQLRILTRLTDAAIFEEFVRRKFVGAKSFSLEGAESLIPLLDLALEKAGRQAVREIVLGMAHRGRLNVLANIIGKEPQQIFREFADVDPELNRGRGDVKYHLGYHADYATSGGQTIHVSLCFNPSHLEFVNPVVLGLARSKQDRTADFARQASLAILIHGDAAVIGEGIVEETLNLSQLPGYTTGGTLHVIVNNRLGFTTSPDEGRSSPYATDIFRMLQIPIFHVNGEHPEAVAQVIDLAMDFRRQFQRDVVIDMYCYRRWGHNEGDEPAFTQPRLYDTIARRPSVRDGYLEHLLTLGEVTRAEADQLAHERRSRLEQALSLARRDDFRQPPTRVLGDVWRAYHGGRERPDDELATGLPRARLQTLLERLARLPDGFQVHRKLERWLDARRAMAAGRQPLDWAAAEALALATLAAEGYRVRLSGQDSQRGTFSQRHAVLHDPTDDRTWTPLAHVESDQAPVEIINSPLSEAAALGFEYGYSLGYPDGLVLWEAQFGDFVNAAQVFVDQFITSAEEKWRHLSGIVLLLPHGNEGQGPEHSSARPERFLQLACRENLQLVVPSTPAQYFHCLRRQALRRWQKPLVVLTPKSLLRHPQVVSPLDDCAQGRFRRVIADGEAPPRPRRILLCCGKIYYELAEHRRQRQIGDVALVRIEQLYPLAEDRLADALEAYPAGTPAVWVQEEPVNMGAWGYLHLRFGSRLLGRFPLRVVARPAAASPASGSHSSYQLEQRELLAAALESSA